MQSVQSEPTASSVRSNSTGEHCYPSMYVSCFVYIVLSSHDCTVCCTSASFVLFPLERACVDRLLTCFHVRCGGACLNRCVDASGGTIKLADGRQLQYDWLVLALGSSTSTFGIPGVKEYAYAFNDFNDSMRVKPYLRMNQRVVNKPRWQGTMTTTEIWAHTVAYHFKRSVLLATKSAFTTLVILS